jgi:UDP-N-acetylmuramyl pentapeptide phosphotransferase/UDP-N-acetylglucosamine-1-phosphate transferase
MSSLLAGFLSSFIATLLIIRYEHLHVHISGDNQFTGPQKFHHTSIPRVGGISIAIGILLATLLHLQSSSSISTELVLLACALPVFAIGLTEDLTKKIGVKLRLLGIAIGATLVSYYLNIQITRLDIPGIDYALSLPGIAFLFTIFAITGLTNAYNIIDGFNGLSSMVGIITLAGLTYVSYVVQDPLLMYLSLMMASATMGFFIWNYPRGLIFLGDGGAYLIGFWVASLSILLTHRHQEISPWFALLINSYPAMETLFTIYRRKIHRGKSPGQPDGIHFHTLIYRRILRPHHCRGIFSANAKTAPYLWALAILGIAPALLWWQSTPRLILACLLFVISYVWLYTKIVQFKTPRWMHLFTTDSA